MKLGGSLRRRRGSGWRVPPFFSALREKLRNRLSRESGGGRGRWSFLGEARTLWLLGILALIGFGSGYLFSTRVIYPLPPPPGDVSILPDLTLETPAEAADTLRAIGLVLGSVDSLNHPVIPAGRIVGQSPLPGQLSLVGDTVRITMSNGPEQRAIPDVLRLQADWARTVLETSGFVVLLDSVESEDPRGGVVSMIPEPGTQATVPMEVHLSVSMGPPEFEMPLLLGLPEEEAIFLLDSLGLEVLEVETRFRFGRDQGLVVEQEPLATEMVREGAAVRLVVGRRGL